MRLAVLALALLASRAFAGEPVVAPVPSTQMHPGYGVVESVAQVRLEPERSAAAGGSAAGAEGAPSRPMYRVTVRMPDGSRQVRDMDRPEFRPGDHVLLTNAGDIVPD